MSQENNRRADNHSEEIEELILYEIDTDEDEELIEFSDVDYDEDFRSDTKTDLGEDSK